LLPKSSYIGMLEDVKSDHAKLHIRKLFGHARYDILFCIRKIRSI